MKKKNHQKTGLSKHTTKLYILTSLLFGIHQSCGYIMCIIYKSTVNDGWRKNFKEKASFKNNIKNNHLHRTREDRLQYIYIYSN